MRICQPVVQYVSSFRPIWVTLDRSAWGFFEGNFKIWACSSNNLPEIKNLDPDLTFLIHLAFSFKIINRNIYVKSMQGIAAW